MSMSTLPPELRSAAWGLVDDEKHTIQVRFDRIPYYTINERRQLIGGLELPPGEVKYRYRLYEVNKPRPVPTLSINSESRTEALYQRPMTHSMQFEEQTAIEFNQEQDVIYFDTLSLVNLYMYATELDVTIEDPLQGLDDIHNLEHPIVQTDEEIPSGMMDLIENHYFSEAINITSASSLPDRAPGQPGVEAALEQLFDDERLLEDNTDLTDEQQQSVRRHLEIEVFGYVEEFFT